MLHLNSIDTQNELIAVPVAEQVRIIGGDVISVQLGDKRLEKELYAQYLLSYSLGEASISGDGDIVTFTKPFKNDTLVDSFKFKDNNSVERI